MQEKILIIEDERDIQEVMQYNLVREGFTVKTASDGQNGLQCVSDWHPDLVLLDLMLPGMDGLDVCRRMKESAQTRDIPVVMVTAKGEESDIVLGLGIGADDYVIKPFSPRELVARVRAVLRRGPMREAPVAAERIERDQLVIDNVRHETRVNGKDIGLTATEMKLLHYLASHPGRVFTRDQLLGRVMGQDVQVIDRNIDVHVRAIRKKLGTCKDWVETVRGVGYRFKEV